MHSFRPCCLSLQTQYTDSRHWNDRGKWQESPRYRPWFLLQRKSAKRPSCSMTPAQHLASAERLYRQCRPIPAICDPNIECQECAPPKLRDRLPSFPLASRGCEPTTVQQPIAVGSMFVILPRVQPAGLRASVAERRLHRSYLRTTTPHRRAEASPSLCRASRTTPCPG